MLFIDDWESYNANDDRNEDFQTNENEDDGTYLDEDMYPDDDNLYPDDDNYDEEPNDLNAPAEDWDAPAEDWDAEMELKNP